MAANWASLLAKLKAAKGLAEVTPGNVVRALDERFMYHDPPELSLQEGVLRGVGREAAPPVPALEEAAPAAAAVEDVAPVSADLPAAEAADPLVAMRDRYRRYAADSETDMLQAGATPDDVRRTLDYWRRVYQDPSPITNYFEPEAFQGVGDRAMFRLYQELHPQLHPQSYADVVEPAADAERAISAPVSADVPAAPQADMESPSLASLDAQLRERPGAWDAGEPGTAPEMVLPPVRRGPPPTAPTTTTEQAGFEPTIARHLVKVPDSGGREPYFQQTSKDVRVPAREQLLDSATEETLPFWQRKAEEQYLAARRMAQRGDTDGAEKASRSAQFWSSLIEEFSQREELTAAELRKQELGASSPLTTDEQVMRRGREVQDNTAPEPRARGFDETFGSESAPGFQIEQAAHDLDMANASVGDQAMQGWDRQENIFFNPDRMRQHASSLLDAAMRQTRRGKVPGDPVQVEMLRGQLPQVTDEQMPQFYKAVLEAAQQKRVDPATGEITRVVPAQRAEGAKSYGRTDESLRNLPQPDVLDAEAQVPAAATTSRSNQARSEINEAADMAPFPEEPARGRRVYDEKTGQSTYIADPEATARYHQERYRRAAEVRTRWEDQMADVAVNGPERLRRQAGLERDKRSRGRDYNPELANNTGKDDELYLDAFYKLPDADVDYLMQLQVRAMHGMKLNPAEKQLLELHDRVSELP